MVGEGEGFAAAEVAHDLGDEDLTGLCPVADAGGELDGAAEVVVVLGDGLAGVEADADADLAARQVALDLEASVDGAHGAREGGEDAVAGVFDFVAAVGGEGGADSLVVAVEDLLGFGVAEGLGELSGGLEVGEEEGTQARGE